MVDPHTVDPARIQNPGEAYALPFEAGRSTGRSRLTDDGGRFRRRPPGAFPFARAVRRRTAWAMSRVADVSGDLALRCRVRGRTTQDSPARAVRIPLLGFRAFNYDLLRNPGMVVRWRKQWSCSWQWLE
jgi:hypothetical protein